MSNKQIIDAIAKGDSVSAEIITKTLNSKLEKAKEVRKIALTNTVFNGKTEESVNEGVSIDDFIKGGDQKISDKEADELFAEIQSDQKSMKKVLANKVFKDGEKGGKNTFKKNTVDWHLFQLGALVGVAGK
jgi:predicted transglutaminase-like protease